MNWMPDWARDDPDQEYWQEQARIDAWIADGEAEERGEVQAKPLEAEWSTVKEVAARHRKSEKTIRRYIAEGLLKAHGDKHHPYRVHRDDEVAWINSARGRHIATRQRRAVKGKQPTTTFREMMK